MGLSTSCKIFAQVQESMAMGWELPLENLRFSFIQRADFLVFS